MQRITGTVSFFVQKPLDSESEIVSWILAELLPVQDELHDAGVNCWSEKTWGIYVETEIRVFSFGG